MKTESDIVRCDVVCDPSEAGGALGQVKQGHPGYNWKLAEVEDAPTPPFPAGSRRYRFHAPRPA